MEVYCHNYVLTYHAVRGISYHVLSQYVITTANCLIVTRYHGIAQ